MRRAAILAALALALVASPALAQPPLDALPAILALQVDQHPAWRAYKDAVAESRADGSEQAAEAARLNGLTTPERLAALRDQIKAQEAAFERQADATQAFYAVLSPEQRRVFDDVTCTPAPPSPMRVGAQASRQDGADWPAARSLREPPAGVRLTPPTP